MRELLRKALCKYPRNQKGPNCRGLGHPLFFNLFFLNVTGKKLTKNVHPLYCCLSPKGESSSSTYENVLHGVRIVNSRRDEPEPSPSSGGSAPACLAGFGSQIARMNVVIRTFTFLELLRTFLKRFLISIINPL